MLRNWTPKCLVADFGCASVRREGREVVWTVTEHGLKALVGVWIFPTYMSLRGRLATRKTYVRLIILVRLVLLIFTSMQSAVARRQYSLSVLSCVQAEDPRLGQIDVTIT